MGPTSKTSLSIQAYFPPAPNSSLSKTPEPMIPSSDTLVGDAFTTEEVQEALKRTAEEQWHPQVEYADCDIRDLIPGPRAVTFMGRIANIFDVGNTQRTPRSAKGCIKLCVKDDQAAITVRLWYANRLPALRLGSLVSIWTNHISNGENGSLASIIAPLFASLFPERDRSCHLMLHENSDDGESMKIPLGYREGRPLNGIMTLQNFIDGGCDVVDAKILVYVKSVGVKKRVERKDGSSIQNVNVLVQDDTAEATLGLWGTSASSPFAPTSVKPTSNHESAAARQGWKSGETILLLQAPSCKTGRNAYLSTTATTLIDINPTIPDALWLRKYSLRQKSREAINPPFPENIFNLENLRSGPVRCLFTLADLDDFARAAPTETFQGYLSVMITEVKLLDCWKRNMLCCGECCNMPLYANATSALCSGCQKSVDLRLSPRILGQVIDETGAVAAGKLLFSDSAWRDLLSRAAEELLRLDYEELKYLSDRLSWCRVNLLFGWTGDEAVAGGRICVLGVCS